MELQKWPSLRALTNGTIDPLSLGYLNVRHTENWEQAEISKQKPLADRSHEAMEVIRKQSRERKQTEL